MPRVISDGRRIPAFSSPRARGTSYRGLIGSPVDIQTTNKAIAGTSNEPYRICPERSQLNLLGKRQPANYGYETLADVEADCRRVGQELSLEIEFHQSNAEYQIIDWIHEAREQAGGIVINPAAFTHTSVAVLVVRVQSGLAEAFDAGEDLVGGFGPDERLGIQVGLIDVGLDCGFQAVGADKDAALETATAQEREPAFHQIEPRRAGRGEVQMPAWSLYEPVVHQARLVA